MSAKKKDEVKQADDRTTLRMTCTPDEHDAVKRFVKYHCGGITLDAFVREAVENRVREVSGKPLSKMAEDVKNAGRLIQEELF